MNNNYNSFPFLFFSCHYELREGGGGGGVKPVPESCSALVQRSIVYLRAVIMCPANASLSLQRSARIRSGHFLEKPGDDVDLGARSSVYVFYSKVPEVGKMISVLES